MQKKICRVPPKCRHPLKMSSSGDPIPSRALVTSAFLYSLTDSGLIDEEESAMGDSIDQKP